MSRMTEGPSSETRLVIHDEAVDDSDIIEIDAQQVVADHGRSGPADQAVQPYLDYLQLLEEVVSAGFEEDLQGYEIREADFWRFEEYQNCTGFSTCLGKHIDRMYLEIEQKAW